MFKVKIYRLKTTVWTTIFLFNLMVHCTKTCLKRVIMTNRMIIRIGAAYVGAIAILTIAATILG